MGTVARVLLRSAAIALTAAAVNATTAGLSAECNDQEKCVWVIGTGWGCFDEGADDKHCHKIHGECITGNGPTCEPVEE
jgi:hypothetical protein